MAETSYVYAGTVRSAAGGSGGIFHQRAGEGQVLGDLAACRRRRRGGRRRRAGRGVVTASAGKSDDAGDDEHDGETRMGVEHGGVG